MTLHLLLMVLAIVCFFLAAINVPQPPRVNMIGAGLCLWALATIVTV
jgi:hypothetical protein